MIGINSSFNQYLSENFTNSALFLAILFYVLSLPINGFAENILSFRMERKSWSQLRDQNVVKQQKDKSCGAAALSTLLTYHFQYSISEEEILKMMEHKGASSFADLSKIANQLGFKAAGMAGNLGHLRKLKIPVILYFHLKKNDHFVVFTGWEDNRFLIADPTWGNRILFIEDILQRWKTRLNNTNYGRFLVVFPNKKTSLTPIKKELPSKNFLTKAFINPLRQFQHF